MTTRVLIVIPAPCPNHDGVRVTHENRQPDGTWAVNHVQKIPIGGVLDHSAVYGGRRIVIEEID